MLFKPGDIFRHTKEGCACCVLKPEHYGVPIVDLIPAVNSTSRSCKCVWVNSTDLFVFIAGYDCPSPYKGCSDMLFLHPEHGLCLVLVVTTSNFERVEEQDT